MNCYKCGKPIPAGAAICPNCGQAVYALYKGGAPAAGRRINGCLFGDVSPKDYRATPRITALPHKVDLRPDCSPIEDQGQLGSCTANAACGALEYFQKKIGKPQAPMSRMFVYYNTRRLNGHIPEDSGAQIAEAMAALLAYGAPEEGHWPYDIGRLAVEPPRPLYAEALKNQPPEYARVERGTGVQGALAQGFPVMFGIALPMRCFQEAAATGLVPAPTPQEKADVGHLAGHAMLIVGYDLDDQSYLVRNSWGAQWGDHGYCRMPFAVVDDNSRPNEFWVLGKLDAANAFDILRPKVQVEGSVAGMAAKMREEIRGSLAKDMADAGKAIRDRLRPREGQ